VRDPLTGAFVAGSADPGGRFGIDQVLQRGSQQPTHRVPMIGFTQVRAEQFLDQPAHGRLVPMGHRGVPSRVTWRFLES